MDAGELVLFSVDGIFRVHGAPGGDLLLVAGFGDGMGDAGAEGIETALLDHAVHDFAKLGTSCLDVVPCAVWFTIHTE